MKHKFKIILSGILVGLLFFSSCTEKWEEMNVDPNNPTEVPATNLLAQSIRYFGDTYYDAWFNMNNVSTYAGHLGKIQYIDESRYYERESVINTNWRDLYRVAVDLENAKKFAMRDGNMNLYAAALTFQSLAFGIGTDSWRNMPFTEAIQGGEGITNPVYDTQEEIYPALLDSLKKAGDLFAEGTLGSIGDGDILFGDDKAKWQKFANSLRLRFANRINEVSSVGAQHIDEILGDPDTYPIMTSNDDNAFLYWPGAAPYKEPWAEDFETRDDHAVGSYLIDYMVTTSDPRLPVYAKPAASDDTYRGVVPGETDDNLGSIAQYSRIGEFFREDPMGFTPFMRYCEVLFIIAEYNNDAATYEDAVRASMAEYEIAEADANAFLTGVPFSMENLYYQKWVSLFKQGHEAWAEARRTDVPQMSAAPGSRFPGHTRPPFRFAYPVTEANLNGANYDTHAAKVTDRFWGQQMWWDTRSGVN
jgi:hypothetical protein